jgi:rubrerythrin
MKLTANDILQVAIEMELYGQTFYESLALGCGHVEIAALATALAKAEKKHHEAFERMLNALPPHQRGPKLTEKDLFTAATDLRKKILPNARTVNKAVQTSDLFKTLDMAIEMETEAVAFYSGLVSESNSLDNAVLAGIANEEKAHLKMLQEVRVRLSTSIPDPLNL